MAVVAKTLMRQLVLETVQWSTVDYIEDLEPISEQDYAVLNELREVLMRHGYEDRFGICLLHKHFDLRPGEAALEESDEKLRVSTIRIVPEQDCQGAMETAWRLGSDEIRAGRNCTLKCHGYGTTGHSKYHECKLI